MDDDRPSLKNSLAEALRPGLREWVLGLAGAMLLAHLVRQPLPGQLAGIIGLAALIVLSVLAFGIGTDALRKAAAGPGGRGARMLASEFAEGLSVRLVVLWVLATIFLAACVQLGHYIGLVAGLTIVILAVPAVTIVLVLSNSFFEALHPPRLLRLAARIGRHDYVRLCALLVIGAAVYLLAAAVFNLVGMPAFARNALLFAVWVWAVLAWFHHAGAVLFAHRVELNLVEPETEPERAPDRFTRDPDALWEEIRARGGTQAMHAELARHLERSGDRQRPAEHARLHIEALLFAFENPGEALDRASRMLELDAGFALGSPDSMLALILAAVDHRVPWLAGRLCANYLEAFPSSVKRNEVRLVGCEALADESGPMRRHAQQWFRELMTAELNDDQRERIGAIAPQYLASRSKRE